MTDSFLAKVISYDKTLNLAKVQPLIVETDGTDRPTVSYPTVAGITPGPNDLVIVVTIRNGSDNAKISRYYEASETNGRIVHVVKPFAGKYVFTGDYEFDGDVKFDGDVEITGDLKIKKDLTVEGDTTLQGKLDVTLDVTIQGDLTVQGNASVAGNLGCGSLQSQPPGSPVVITDGLTVTGDAIVTGDLNVTGSLTAAAATIGAVTFSTHSHAYLSPGGPSFTGPPV